MPTPQQILEGLTAVADSAQPFAIAWHVALLAATVALLAGWRPSRRLAGSLLVTPLLSVSVLAWLHANPFNGIIIGAVALALLVLALRLPSAPVSRGPSWAWGAGLVMVAFGWVYPHFLDSGGPWRYLYAAPLGLVPCPSFSAIIGFALMAGGLQARGWSGVLACGGLFYGLFGALRLGVRIDIVLVGGALALAAVSLRAVRPDAR
ncbi:MAG: hypothetical protein ACP5KN_14595 [Armatimonadota bacterium]